MEDRPDAARDTGTSGGPSVTHRLLAGFAGKPILGVSLVVLVVLSLGFLVALLLVVF